MDNDKVYQVAQAIFFIIMGSILGASAFAILLDYSLQTIKEWQTLIGSLSAVFAGIIAFFSVKLQISEKKTDVSRSFWILFYSRTQKVRLNIDRILELLRFVCENCRLVQLPFDGISSWDNYFEESLRLEIKIDEQINEIQELAGLILHSLYECSREPRHIDPNSLRYFTDSIFIIEHIKEDTRSLQNLTTGLSSQDQNLTFIREKITHVTEMCQAFDYAISGLRNKAREILTSQIQK